MSEQLGLRWDQVHEEAERLEHHISPMLEAHIATVLGDPQIDRTVIPIPTPSGELPPQPSVALTRLPPGQAATIVSVPDEDPELLRYFAARNMYPGTPVVVLAREPFDGPLYIRIGADAESREHALGVPAAQRVRVTVPTAASAANLAAGIGRPR